MGQIRKCTFRISVIGKLGLLLQKWYLEILTENEEMQHKCCGNGYY